MHNVSLDNETLARIHKWRGSCHVFDHVDPLRTCHLVIDLQNAYTQVGSAMHVPNADRVIPSVNLVSRALRDSGGINVFTRMTVTSQTWSTWSVWLNDFCGAERREATVAALSTGNTLHGLDSALDVLDQDLVWDKTRYSAFLPESDGFEEMLVSRGIDTLIISGTVTNCCCETTARDAMQRNFRVLFLSDATAALSDRDHNATLNNMLAIFADVRTAASTVDLICSAAVSGPVA
ncbi:MAG: cysteine hydrolase [Bifidobacteriaceae bacterium]|jgi:ureidoacrylate peracid hydrolase|nr:cysteine hydrolase [Bifidobacteriaceae bacterium]